MITAIIIAALFHVAETSYLDAAELTLCLLFALALMGKGIILLVTAWRHQ